MFFHALLLSLVVTRVCALIVTAGSPCAATCNSKNGTYWPDLVCSDNDFSSTTKGQLLKQCLQCESQSLYVNGTRSDQYWFVCMHFVPGIEFWLTLFAVHMKYIQQECLIDTNIPHTTGAIACADECTPLKNVLETLWISSTPFLPQYDYCEADADAFPKHGPKCAKCLQAQKGSIAVGNMVETMTNACVNKPLAIDGKLVSTSRELFNTTIIPLPSSTSTSSATTRSTMIPSVTPTASDTSESLSSNSAVPSSSAHQGLSTASAAGVGVGAAVGIIALAGGFAFLVMRRKRSRSAHESEEPLNQYGSGTDLKELKDKNVYREMHADAYRPEIYSRETMEADSKPVGKSFPVSELPAYSDR